MLLTIRTAHQPPTDLGYLLHKHPDRFQSFELSFGQAHVFYPEILEDSITAAILLDVDPVAMVRGKSRGRRESGLLDQYVNDRPYVASSFMSVAISQVFGSAMAGRCKDRPDLVNQPMPLVAQLDVLPIRMGTQSLHRIFEPLGYEVQSTRVALDDRFPQWGDSPYHSVRLSATKTVAELLTHLYVLIPVFDNEKHYYVGDDELEKLLAKGAGWLADHPEKDQITRRYLRNCPSLYREALSRLVGKSDAAENPGLDDKQEKSLEGAIRLNEQRHQAVVRELVASGAKTVIDLGCGEGKLVRELLKHPQFQRVVAVDVSVSALEIAAKRLRFDRLFSNQHDRLELMHGSLTYRDNRFANFDSAAVVEVIEHLDPSRLSAFEKVLFGSARPKTVVLTTPNQEYNAVWESLPAGAMRHHDHRFEWNRLQFRQWCEKIAETYGYKVRIEMIGTPDERFGGPTQMGVFT
jgi:3' terminal RNA ribose 2'-O-methyltransferase Hen1